MTCSETHAAITLKEIRRSVQADSALFGERLKPWLGLRPSMFKPVSPGVNEPRTKLSYTPRPCSTQWNDNTG